MLVLGLFEGYLTTRLGKNINVLQLIYFITDDEAKIKEIKTKRRK